MEAVPALLRWLNAHDLPKEVILTCNHEDASRGPRNTQVVQWDACLKDASIGIVAQLLALGIQKVHVLACTVNPADVSEQVNKWASLTPGYVDGIQAIKKGVLKGPDVLVLGQIPLPRRSMIGMSVRDKSAIPIKADDTERTLKAFEVLQAKGIVKRGEGLEAKLGGVRLGAVGCVACGVCVRACPNDALTLVHEANRSVLWQTSDQCRAEQDCVRLCPEKALWIQGDMRLGDLLDEPERLLETVDTAACEKCGMRHPASEGRLCRTCQFRSENPFGTSFVPPTVSR